MKDFVFQQFAIKQTRQVFRVGTDGVLLGALCNVSKAKNILEIGSGTGLISLMLAQRNPDAEILAIDINEEAAKLTQENFKNSIFSERLKAVHSDFKNFSSEISFDFIVSNPPYFEENDSSKDILARQKIELSFQRLIENTSAHLSKTGGTFSVIIPSAETENFVEICKKNQLLLQRKINIYGIEGGILKRNILEFSFSDKISVEENFTIEKSPRQYSDQYLDVTKNFHVFSKKV